MRYQYDNNYYSDRQLWYSLQRSFALIIGVIMLICAPIVEQHLRTQEQEMLTRTLEYFSQNYDFREANLPESIESVVVQDFEHLGYRRYDIKLVTRNYYYDGEISHGRLYTSVKEANETQMAELTKGIIIAAIVLIVLNLAWSFISRNYLFCTLYALLEDAGFAIKRFFHEGVL